MPRARKTCPGALEWETFEVGNGVKLYVCRANGIVLFWMLGIATVITGGACFGEKLEGGSERRCTGTGELPVSTA